ncbi:hypothetical protein ACI2L1_00040 [Streptomyces sp. NPDC019531]|uniref:hypothetical protein n=1 Tax=Streptomyces sp. NPDC019531 TaxID=3365062 RepID=UPI00384D714D
MISMFALPEGRRTTSRGMRGLDTLATTAAGALSVTAGVPVGGIVTRRAQDRHWIRDLQLVAFQELFSHYTKFTMEIRRARADRRAWDYDSGDWSATLMRMRLIAPTEVAMEIDVFGTAINSLWTRWHEGNAPHCTNR